MTAEQIIAPITRSEVSSRLRLVQPPAARVSTLGFVVLVVALIVAGLTGVMLISTTVSAQSKELSRLRQEAVVLGYHADGLEAEFQHVTSTNALALSAAELGMTPNPYPAFINLADGAITGQPTPVTGEELPFLRGVAAPPSPDSIVVAEPQETAPEDEAAAAEDAQEDPAAGEAAETGAQP